MSSAKLKVWEHPKNSGIKIRERLNNQLKDGNYTIGYRVSLPTRLTGKRSIQLKQFKEKAQATAWAEKQYHSYRQLGINAQDITVSERMDALTALRTLKPCNLSLSDAAKIISELLAITEGNSSDLKQYVTFARERLEPKGGKKTFSEVAEELVKMKWTSDLRPRSLNDFQMRSAYIGKTLGSFKMVEIGKEIIVDWLRSLDLSARSKRNYLAVISEILRHGIQQKYIAENPIDSISLAEMKSIKGFFSESREPNILCIEDAKRLITAAHETDDDLGLLPVVTLGLFCGLRTEELKRLEWSDLKLNDSEPYVCIPPGKAKKRRIRNVPIPPNAIKWLELAQRKQESITLNNYFNQYQRLFRKLLIRAGFVRIELNDSKKKYVSTWTENNMRHSFGSYHYALLGDSMLTSRLLGHKSSDHVLFDHYRALTTKTEAERYFNL